MRGGAFDGLGLGGVDSRATGGLAFDIEKCLVSALTTAWALGPGTTGVV